MAGTGKVIGHLTAERLRDLISYDEDTGVFTWRFSRGRARIGDPAGCVDGHGYVSIGVDGRTYLAHRLAWLYVHGYWPPDGVDHINGARDDNRIANLRKASNAENLQNQRRAHASNRTSRLLGATWDASRGLWKAAISVSGKIKNLGRYVTAEEAHAAYLAAKSRLHPFQTISATTKE